MTVQVVAFPQDGVFGAHTQTLMHQAMQLNPDVVGGIAFIEKGTAAQQAHVNMCFDLARQYDKDVHFVADDVADPNCRTLEMIARATIANGWYGRVACTQCAALSFYPDDYAAQVIALVKQAGITIYSNSHVSLIATEFDTQKYPWTRNTTRLRQLLEAGVPIVCGQDDIDNWFYPFGRNDMLEVAQFMAHQGQFAWHGEVNKVLPMVTTTPAQVLRMPNYGLHVGASANLVVLDCPDWHSAIQFQPAKSFVILRGALVVASQRLFDWKVGL
jgi:cytosine deaminase